MGEEWYEAAAGAIERLAKAGAELTEADRRDVELYAEVGKDTLRQLFKLAIGEALGGAQCCA